MSISQAAKSQLFESSRSLVALLPDPMVLGETSKPFRGLVVGAVQSGKTASMMGLTAMALDQGYRIIVVLSGNKDDLRRQSARRFNSQLLRRSELIPGTSSSRTLPLTAEEGRIPAFSLPYHKDSHQFAGFHLSLQSALAQEQPAVIVIKKHITSIEDVRRKLAIAYDRFGVESLPTLVLDDECDDSSVDSRDMPIPTAIAGLWRRGGDHPSVAYVGYTATSAANLLQNRDNDLFPENFVYLLKYPASGSSPLSFEEPVADSWYTGGHTFYEEFGDQAGSAENCLVATIVRPEHAQSATGDNTSLIDALRAFTVAGAYRLALAPNWSLYDPVHFPKPHSMLVQTSAAQVDHRAWLERIGTLFGVAQRRADGLYKWDPGAVMADVLGREGDWVRWYEDFAQSRARILEERPRISGGSVASWSAVKSLIPAFVENLTIKVVNSDEDVGSDLDYAPRVLESGQIGRPQDVFVIVIGGSKLSRGLTLEGLCVSYFTRWNPYPTEDTVLQLSRWLGFRGPHLEFCRLITTARISGELQSMQANDVGLRLQLADLMRELKSPADAALVISANPRALPTGKLGEGKVRDLCYSPFAAVFRRVEIADQNLQRDNAAAALAFVQRIQQRGPETVTSASGATRGLVSRGWPATDVADVLDAWAFADHNPSAIASAAPAFYRQPATDRPIVAGRTLADDPYQVAAYLREWFTRGDAPLFNVGVAFGELAEGSAPFGFSLVNREITQDAEAVGGWTGRRPGWRGDVLFDDPSGAYLPTGETERREGSAGLLLLYIIHRNARGRRGEGQPRVFHTPMFGIVIPKGGPVWRRVTVDHRRVIT